MRLLTAACFLAFSVHVLAASAVCATETAPTTQPAAEVGVDPAADELLTRIEAKAKDLRTFKADLRYDRNQVLVGDKQRRFGKIVYVVGPPAKFAVQFDRLLVDGRVEQQNQWFIYDAKWLVERNDAEKSFIKRQVVPPDAPKDQSDPLNLGEGPFALPITTKKDQILKKFDVVIEPQMKETDPKNTVHLKLTPRAGVKSDLTRIDLWYDLETLLPTQARTLDESENETVILVNKIVVNEPVEDQVFDAAEPKDRGWSVQVVPWEKGK